MNLLSDELSETTVVDDLRTCSASLARGDNNGGGGQSSRVDFKRHQTTTIDSSIQTEAFLIYPYEHLFPAVLPNWFDCQHGKVRLLKNTVFHLQLQALFMPSKKKDIIETFSDFCIHLFRSKCWCQSYKLFYDQLDYLKIIELKTGLFLYLNLQLNAKQFYSE